VIDVEEREKEEVEPNFHATPANIFEYLSRQATPASRSKANLRGQANKKVSIKSDKQDFDKSDFDKSSSDSEHGLRELLARKQREHFANEEKERQRKLREAQERRQLLLKQIEPYKAELMSDIMQEISMIEPMHLTNAGKRSIISNAFSKPRDSNQFFVYVKNLGLMSRDNFFRMSSEGGNFVKGERGFQLLFDSRNIFPNHNGSESGFQISNGMLLMKANTYVVHSVNFDDFSSSEFFRAESEIMDVDYHNDTGLLAVATRTHGNMLFNSRTGATLRLPHLGKRSSLIFFSPDGRYVATYSDRSPIVSIFEVDTRGKLRDIYVGRDLRSARFSEDSEDILITFSSSGKLKVIAVETDTLIDEYDFDIDEYDVVEWSREGMNIHGTNVDINATGQFIQSNRTECGRFVLRETEVIDTVGSLSVEFRNHSIVPVPLYPEHSYIGRDSEIFSATLTTVNKDLNVHGFSIVALNSKIFELLWSSSVI